MYTIAGFILQPSVAKYDQHLQFWHVKVGYLSVRPLPFEMRWMLKTKSIVNAAATGQLQALDLYKQS